MDNTALAGLPRLVRVSDEVRLRGQTAVAIAVSVAAYWVLGWISDEPLDLLTTAANFGVVCVLVGGAALAVSFRRIKAGLVAPPRPPSLCVHETRAAARERRTKMMGLVAVVVIALLAFDRTTGGEGQMAGLVTGLFVAVGTVDWWEGTRWKAAEKARGSLLYVLVRATALMSPYGVTDVYETPRPTDEYASRDPETEYFL
jgi:hypothetical protein